VEEELLEILTKLLDSGCRTFHFMPQLNERCVEHLVAIVRGRRRIDAGRDARMRSDLAVNNRFVAV
jgi:hypothetical protein